ncbi:MAG TPA: hypothetical protein VNS32_06095, partial [Flavisolibacter sp.]|nr:hypothetical protein [Flavisolibacter sp.]
SGKDFFNQSSTRFFCCWFIIAFFLANHELFIKAIQPLHFTRGYVWTSLFLLGLPALHHLFQNKQMKHRNLVLLIFSCLFFSDNFLWITNNVRSAALTPSVGYLTAEQRNLLKIIERNSDNTTLLIGSDDIPYLCTVYTKAYPWISHPYTTPFVAKKQAAYNDFMKNNVVDPLWKNRKLIFIFRKDRPEELQRSQSLSFPVEIIANTSGYIVYKAMITDK